MIKLGAKFAEFRRCTIDGYSIPQINAETTPDTFCPRCEQIQFKDFESHGLIGEYPPKHLEKETTDDP